MGNILRLPNTIGTTMQRLITIVGIVLVPRNPIVAQITEADYQQRARIFSFDPREDISEMIKQEQQTPGGGVRRRVVVLDVRSEDEVAKKAFPVVRHNNNSLVHVSCPVKNDDASTLKRRAPKLLPDKNAPIVVVCQTGRRANAAKQVLASMEYTKLYNAGGLEDLLPLLSLWKKDARTNERTIVVELSYTACHVRDTNTTPRPVFAMKYAGTEGVVSWMACVCVSFATYYPLARILCGPTDFLR